MEHGDASPGIAVFFVVSVVSVGSRVCCRGSGETGAFGGFCYCAGE